MKRFCERVAREDVHVNFLFQYFLKIQNICKLHFKIEGAYTPMFQNNTPVVMFKYYKFTTPLSSKVVFIN
jgi:hypothetical protein